VCYYITTSFLLLRALAVLLGRLSPTKRNQTKIAGGFRRKSMDGRMRATFLFRWQAMRERARESERDREMERKEAKEEEEERETESQSHAYVYIYLYRVFIWQLHGDA
jgi:hypothetical protein